MVCFATGFFKINEARGHSLDHVMNEGTIDIDFIPMASNPATSATEKTRVQ
jgi:hypothetical protein